MLWGFFGLDGVFLRARRNFKAYTCLGALLPIFVVLQPQSPIAFSFFFFFEREELFVCFSEVFFSFPLSCMIPTH